MAKKVMKACDELGVRYIMAPYEADAQLAYMQRMGHIAAVITEDSDLLVFGCRETLYVALCDTLCGMCERAVRFTSCTTSLHDLSNFFFSLQSCSVVVASCPPPSFFVCLFVSISVHCMYPQCWNRNRQLKEAYVVSRTALEQQ